MSRKDLYIRLCNERTDIPLFLQPWWLDSVCNSWDVAMTSNGDHISGVWPYAIDKKAGVTILRNPKLTPYMGPHIFYPPDIKESNTDSFEHETVTELLKQIPDAKVWHLAMQPEMKQVGLFKHAGLKTNAQQTFLLDLNADEQTLLANMKENNRRNIRSAEKEIEIVNDPSQLKQLYKFQKDTLDSKGVMQAYSFAQLQKVMEACLAHKHSALWVARTNNDVQAIVWHAWDSKCSYYLMGGQNHDGNSYKAMTALLWHTIKEAKRSGNKLFDFEGSMDEGVERFFRNFGGKRALYLVLQKNDSLLWKIKKMIRK